MLDIIFIPVIACVFLIEMTKSITIEKLPYDARNFNVVIEYLNVYFYLKVIAIVLELKYSIKSAL